MYAVANSNNIPTNLYEPLPVGGGQCHTLINMLSFCDKINNNGKTQHDSLHSPLTCLCHTFPFQAPRDLRGRWQAIKACLSHIPRSVDPKFTSFRSLYPYRLYLNQRKGLLEPDARWIWIQNACLNFVAKSPSLSLHPLLFLCWRIGCCIQICWFPLLKTHECSNHISTHN